MGVMDGRDRSLTMPLARVPDYFLTPHEAEYYGLISTGQRKASHAYDDLLTKAQVLFSGTDSNAVKSPILFDSAQVRA